MVTPGRATGRWYLVRHGETDWSREGRIHGHADSALNDQGRQQMRCVAGKLSGCGFSAVYASDLGRAIESARLIVQGSGIPIEADRDLREFSYGAWEGLTPHEAEAQDPETYAARMGLDADAFAAPGGETAPQLLQRVRRFYERAVARHKSSDDVLVVAHGGSIRALLVCLLGLPDDSLWRFGVDRGGLSVVRDHPGGRVLELWNEALCSSGTEGVEA